MALGSDACCWLIKLVIFLDLQINTTKIKKTRQLTSWWDLPIKFEQWVCLCRNLKAWRLEFPAHCTKVEPLRCFRSTTQRCVLWGGAWSVSWRWHEALGTKDDRRTTVKAWHFVCFTDGSNRKVLTKKLLELWPWWNSHECACGMSGFQFIEPCITTATKKLMTPSSQHVPTRWFVFCIHLPLGLVYSPLQSKETNHSAARVGTSVGVVAWAVLWKTWQQKCVTQNRETWSVLVKASFYVYKWLPEYQFLYIYIYLHIHIFMYRYTHISTYVIYSM